MIGDFAPLPAGPFRTIMADPPWRFATFSAKGRDRCPDAPVSDSRRYYRNKQRQNAPERHYATMSLAEIMEVNVQDISADNCLLFMWAIDPMIPEAIEVGRHWGFKYKTVGFYWVKRRRVTSKRTRPDPDAEFPMGTGYWTRANPEPCLLFTRGSPKRLSASIRKLIVAPRREHSQKPDEAYERLERLAEGPRADLFSRASRPNWTAWGNQMGRLDSIAAE